MDLLYILPPAFAFILDISLVLLVFQRHWRSFLHRIFSVFLLNVSVWALFIFLLRMSSDVHQASTWQLAVTSVAHGTGLFFYHFTVVFTNIRPKKWVLPAGYLLWAVFVVLGAAGVIVTGSQVKPYGYAPVITSMVGPYILYTYVFIFLGLANLFKAYRTSSSNTEKNRAAYIIIGIICSLLGALTDLLPVLGISIYPLGIYGNIVFCILTAIAIMRHNLMDIRIIIRRGVSFLLLSTIIAIPYSAGALLFGYIISGHLDLVWLWLVILLFVLAFILQPLWSSAQNRIDRLFYRERYDFLKALEEFTEETHSVSHLDEMGNSLVRLTRQALLSSSTRLLLRSESHDFITISSSGNYVTELTLKSENPVLRMIQSGMKLMRRRDLDINSQLLSLTQKEMDEIKEAQPELFVPISTRSNELVGIIILGEKLNGQLYSEEEERLLLSVASRMAVELENARLYDVEKTMRALLEEQDKQKTEFLHSVAHELKTPLTSIISSSELLDDKIKTDDDIIHRLIGNLRRSSENLDRRVSELLELARTQHRTIKLVLKPVEIDGALREIASDMDGLFESRNQKLSIDIPDVLPVVNAERGRLEQIVYNLLSNASKFSPDKSEIILRAREDGNYVIVEVQDEASKITDTEKGKIFTPYYRGEGTAEQREVPGLGLGLYIAKELVELHRGKIWIDTSLNRGNIFAFSLPVLE